MSAAAPIESAGITARAPAGCEARLRTRGPADGGEVAVAATGANRPVLHVSTAPLPAGRGDFGSGVVESMGPGDVLVALVELDPAQAGTPLVSRRGLPRRLAPARYAPHTMQRTIHGQAGTQVFFTAHGRAFCLYAVLGSHARRHELAPIVDRILAGIDIGPG